LPVYDKHEWYIPVHTNIKEELTEIEKNNIKLLLIYEKNTEEYYDEFGRG
jgi:thioredoxin-related protein